jgi:DNA-binding transcriptional LysR family regulator
VAGLPLLAKFQSRLTTNSREDPFLALSAGRTPRYIFDEACKEVDIKPNIAFEAMDLTTLRGMVAAGLGVALLPPVTSRVRGVVEVKLSDPKPIRSIGIARVQGRQQPPCAKNFLAFAEKLCAKP